MINIIFLISNIILINNLSIKYDLNTDRILYTNKKNETYINFFNNSYSKIGLINYNDLNRKKKLV